MSIAGAYAGGRHGEAYRLDRLGDAGGAFRRACPLRRHSLRRPGGALRPRDRRRRLRASHNDLLRSRHAMPGTSASAARESGADRVVMLLDKEATRAAVEGAWRRSAGPGCGRRYAGLHLCRAWHAGAGAPKATRTSPTASTRIFPSRVTASRAVRSPSVSSITSGAMAEGRAGEEGPCVLRGRCLPLRDDVPGSSLGLTFRSAPRIAIDPAELLEFTPPEPAVPEKVGADDDATVLAVSRTSASCRRSRSTAPCAAPCPIPCARSRGGGRRGWRRRGDGARADDVRPAPRCSS